MEKNLTGYQGTTLSVHAKGYSNSSNFSKAVAKPGRLEENLPGYFYFLNDNPKSIIEAEPLQNLAGWPSTMVRQMVRQKAHQPKLTNQLRRQKKTYRATFPA